MLRKIRFGSGRFVFGSGGGFRQAILLKLRSFQEAAGTIGTIVSGAVCWGFSRHSSEEYG